MHMHTSIPKSSSIFITFPNMEMYCIKLANSQQFRRRWSKPGSSERCCSGAASTSEWVRFRDTIAAGSVHLRRRGAKRLGRWKKGLLPASVGTLRNRTETRENPNWVKIQTINTNSCCKSRLVVLSRARESSCRAKEAKLAMSSARRRRVESGDVSEPRQGYFTITTLHQGWKGLYCELKLIKIVIIFGTWNQCIQETKQNNTIKIGKIYISPWTARFECI